MSGLRRPVGTGLLSALFALAGTAGPAAASPAVPGTVVGAASSDTASQLTPSAPGWYQVPIDHPTPATDPLPAALMRGTSGAAPGPVIDAGQAQAVVAALWELRNDAFRTGSNTPAGGLTCGVVREETYWDFPGSTLYQPKAQNNWGSRIAPGLYRAIVSSSISPTLFR